ncbi:MAG: CPBP family intramembrane metalloprotease [Actinobacteria bacterium]|jgi:membrane protease YdiL (CAAX protease family)|nr:CPBP family intramembrane metalloprotease [Actinomycetota bacterium]
MTSEDAVEAGRPRPSAPALAPDTWTPSVPDRRTLRAEVWLVLWVSIAASGLRALLSLVDSLTKGTPLRQQTQSLIVTYVADRPWLDVLYQGTRIGLSLIPVLLVIHLLRRSGEGMRAIGFDFRDAGRDLLKGAALAALIGITGLGLYIAAFNLGFSVRLAAVDLSGGWWNAAWPLLYAAYNAILEEVIVLAYLLHRADQLGWRPWQAVGTSALLRGAYHLYQGFGGFVGNVAMGVVFGVLYRRWRRVMPFIYAHFFIDAVAFVGYVALHGKVAWLP